MYDKEPYAISPPKDSNAIKFPLRGNIFAYYDKIRNTVRVINPDIKDTGLQVLREDYADSMTVGDFFDHIERLKTLFNTK